jgi:hypothetical protein
MVLVTARSRSPRRPSSANVAVRLVAAVPGDDVRDCRSLASIVAALARRSMPSLIEATVIPAVVFYLCMNHIGFGGAMVAVLSWSYGAVLRRWLLRIQIPTILWLAVSGLTMRTVLGFASGSFVYFMQPILTTIVLAAVFLGSLCLGQPIIGRFAGDFCHLEPEVAVRPAIVHLFAGLTGLWAGVHLLNALMTFGLLVSVPTSTYILLKTILNLVITLVAIIVTVTWSMRTARSEHLVMAPAV